MKKENFNKIKLDKSLLAQKKNYFLGNVVLQDISKNIGVKDQKVYYAGFKNGARTKVHYHEGSQTLVITQGTGILVLYRRTNLSGKHVKIRKATSSILKTGDVVYIPKNTLHWHGALKGKNFGHIAFNGFTSKGREAMTIWYDSSKTLAVRIP
ncbi:MAG: cupin domain-containing protein [Thaumarchaeota archaeon]|nr:cupin domain-containing protein [Nitrososphaerota archaeon]